MTACSGHELARLELGKRSWTDVAELILRLR